MIGIIYKSAFTLQNYCDGFKCLKYFNVLCYIDSKFLEIRRGCATHLTIM